MAIQLNCRALTTNERAENSGMTHQAVLKPADLASMTTVATPLIFNLFKTIAGDVLIKASLRLQPALKDASDAAFNSTTLSFGDEDLATRFFSAVQANENGTEVIHSFENTAFGPYTAEKQIIFTVNSMAAKALSDIDVGEAVLNFELYRMSILGVGIDT